MVVGQIVFCPSKTGSASICRAWARISKKPTIHTHTLRYLVVTDIKDSLFLKYIEKNFKKNLSYVFPLDEDHVEFTVREGPFNNLKQIFEYFDSFKIVTSIRDPLSRNISQFMQDLTVDQINAAIDGIFSRNAEVVPKLDPKKVPTIGEVCHTLKLIEGKHFCVLLKNASVYMQKN